ncbi:hypothetical protein PE067_06795, partial [Paracoccus sp. DMF-8]|uniref:hypothetical protein n=1 Tax=Paracoccus sp. DMF-8 TaxID=3019445 RepID=UPI0023E83399
YRWRPDAVQPILPEKQGNGGDGATCMKHGLASRPDSLVTDHGISLQGNEKPRQMWRGLCDVKVG